MVWNHNQYVMVKSGLVSSGKLRSGKVWFEGVVAQHIKYDRLEK